MKDSATFQLNHPLSFISSDWQLLKFRLPRGKPSRSNGSDPGYIWVITILHCKKIHADSALINSAGFILGVRRARDWSRGWVFNANVLSFCTWFWEQSLLLLASRYRGTPGRTKKTRLRDLDNCADIPDITDHTRIKKLWSWNGSLALLLAMYTKAALCLPLAVCPWMQVPNKSRLCQQTVNILYGGTHCQIKQVYQRTRGHLFLFHSFCSFFFSRL